MRRLAALAETDAVLMPEHLSPLEAQAAPAVLVRALVMEAMAPAALVQPGSGVAAGGGVGVGDPGGTGDGGLGGTGLGEVEVPPSWEIVRGLAVAERTQRVDEGATTSVSAVPHTRM